MRAEEILWVFTFYIITFNVSWEDNDQKGDKSNKVRKEGENFEFEDVISNVANSSLFYSFILLVKFQIDESRM